MSTRAQRRCELTGEALAARLARDRQPGGGGHLAQSWLGRAGQVVEPVFAPLGWDWRVSAAVIAGFPAREVVVAVLGTIYAVGDEADERSLAERLDGRNLARRRAGLHAADGARLAVVLRVVPAVRGDARGHPAGNEQLALACVRLGLHDGAGVWGGLADLPAR